MESPKFRIESDLQLWQSRPRLKQTLTSLEELLSEPYLKTKPRLFWGFIADRLNLCRQSGYSTTHFYLKRMLERYKPKDFIIVTDSYLGHLQKSGF